jgi:mannosyltransferase OCH1-like enzyme
MIPRNLFRTVPEKTSQHVETWWKWAVEFHQGWNCQTYRDPLNPDEFPMTSPYWKHCQHGAQLAGLVRLELVYTHGGVYIDSDFQCYRSFGHLLGLEGFAGWEDEKVVPDAVFGARAGHPAIEQCIETATALVEMGKGPWDTGPGVFTDVLPRRQDFILFPPAILYPYHYSQKKKASVAKKYYGDNPWTIGAHHWNASWVGK